jgi:hypothetical protein
MFVIYHTTSTMQVGPTERGAPHSLYAKYYKTRSAALRTAQKWNDRWSAAGDHRCGCGPEGLYGPGPYGVAHVDHYRTSVVRKVTRTNLLSGKDYTEDSNTPGFCSPSSEAYWSM